MKKSLLISLLFVSQFVFAQKLPCSKPEFRQFDFWIGEWEAFGVNGKKGGDSKISLILDSCIILEEWTSAGVQQGLRYAGKSFNTWNAASKQWQQTWNSPFYGVQEQGGWFLAFHCFTRYVKVTFFRGTSLRPVPSGESKHQEVRYLDVYENAPLDQAQFVAWVQQASRLPGERL